MVLFVFVACLEAPELVNFSFLEPVKKALSCFSSAFMRMIVYLVLCLTFAGSSYGYGFIAGIFVAILAIFYGYISFCYKEQSPPTDNK